jgi:predicted transcriptional regulator
MKKPPAVNEATLVAQVAEGLKDVEHGRVVSNAAIISWFATWGDDDEQHAPPCRDFACEGDDR